MYVELYRTNPKYQETYGRRQCSTVRRCKRGNYCICRTEYDRYAYKIVEAEDYLGSMACEIVV